MRQFQPGIHAQRQHGQEAFLINPLRHNLPHLHAGNTHIGALTEAINPIKLRGQVHSGARKAAPRAGDGIAKEARRNGQHHQTGQNLRQTALLHRNGLSKGRRQRPGVQAS